MCIERLIGVPWGVIGPEAGIPTLAKCLLPSNRVFQNEICLVYMINASVDEA